MTTGDKFSLRIKNCHCETNVYLHPPNENTDPPMYSGSMTKEPLGIDFYLNNVDHDWKTDFINTISKFSILICQMMKDVTCYNEFHKNNWISIALEMDFLVRTSETVLSLKQVFTTNELYVLCLYCDPCEPFKLVYISWFSNSVEHLNSKLSSFSNNNPPIVYVHLVMYQHYYDDLKQNQRKTQFNVLQRISNFVGDATLYDYLVDSHVIGNLLPKNVTINYLNGADYERSDFLNIQMDSCPDSKFIPYHSKLRPFIEMTPQIQISKYQDVGLIFHKRRLRFLACHRKQVHWMHQLKELITVFDYYMWSLIIIFIYALLYILKITSQQVSKDKCSKANHEYFQLFGTLLDQSSAIFQNAELNRNPSFCCSLMCAPIALLFLTNQYKGDNIEKLTT